MTYLNIYDLANAQGFRSRLTSTLGVAAGALVTTPKPPDQTAAVYAKRYALAQNVLRDPAAIVPAFVWAVVANTTIAQKGLDSTDDELLFQTMSVWDVVAGVTPEDHAV